ncbi:MAG: endolytic transglycosylase MltG, partial [Syntrophales bacterium]|nr:endolytic transglycosylase MltG [Syntrophales bacterium]
MTLLRRGEKGFIRLFLIVFLLGCSMAILYFVSQPVGSEPHKTVLVDIPKGTGFMQIIDLLDQAGLVNNRPLYYALALTRGAARNIRAGEYELSDAMTPLEIINKLVHGNIRFYMVTIPEDFTVREIAARLASFRLADEKAFLALAADRPFLSSLGINGTSIEGYLYPETYKLDRSMGTREIMRTMVQQFWKVVTPELKQKSSELGLSITQVVTLASMIGKETGYQEEKPLVSAVFHNRLHKGMKLQSDPTAVYNLENFEGAVRKKHLLREHPYNTYKINGLPPGPIGNPDINSIKAALYPAKVEYLYFVSNNNGSHNFTT